MSSLYQKAHFVLSAASTKQLPKDEGVEIAIVGRSNAGKSSVLNRLTQNKQLARVSKTPGRTQLLNVFALDDSRRIVDLPGYGFAKVPLSIKQKWEKLVDSYIQTRKSLQGLVLVMDIRHPFKPLDLQMLDYCNQRALLVHILLNKTDKVSKREAAACLHKAKALVKMYQCPVTYQPFSALKNSGIKELQGMLDAWFGCGTLKNPKE